MIVNVFKIKNRRFLSGFTTDSKGSNLPTDYGRWQFVKTIDLNSDSPIVGADPVDIITDIKDQGYSIQKADIQFQERIIKDFPE